MKINCSHCGEEAKKSLGHYNRAIKLDMKMFCSKQCSNESRKTTREQKVEAKTLYDIEYRKKNYDKLQARKKSYYESNKIKILEKERHKRDSDEYRKKHAEYCRDPEQRKKERFRRYKRILGEDYNELTKFCIACEEDKFILEFEHSPIFPDKRRHICNQCEKEQQDKYGYSTRGTMAAMKSRRYTNLSHVDFAKHPYLIEANKYLIILKQLLYEKC